MNIQRIPITTTSPEVPEDVIPHVSPSARPDQCVAIANFVWRKIEQALSDAGEAVRELNSGLHSTGVEDADAILGYIREHATTSRLRGICNANIGRGADEDCYRNARCVRQVL
jgi:hypothetical protein